MDIVLLNGVDNGREDLIDIMRAIEIHEVQGQSLKPISKILKLIQMFVQP